MTINVTKQIVDEYGEALTTMDKAKLLLNRVKDMLNLHKIKYNEPILTGSFVLHYYFPKFRYPHDVDVVFNISLDSYPEFCRLPSYMSITFPNSKECKYKVVKRDITLSFIIEGWLNIIFKIEQEPQDISVNTCFGMKMHTIDSIIEYKNLYSRFKDYKDQVELNMVMAKCSGEEIITVLSKLEFDNYEWANDEDE